jgi:hypothetical protein
MAHQSLANQALPECHAVQTLWRAKLYQSGIEDLVSVAQRVMSCISTSDHGERWPIIGRGLRVNTPFLLE